MFNTGDRISRDTHYQLATIERHGNVVDVIEEARVAYVVFDNHVDSEPTACTFESLRLIKSAETPAHVEYMTVENFHKLSEADKDIRIFNPGDSVAALVDEYDTPLKVVHGKVFGSVHSDRTGVLYKVITREGEKFVGLAPRSLVNI